MAATVQMLPAIMASLPIFESSASALGGGPAAVGGTIAAQEENEQFLLRAFRSFAEAAGSLERSYGLLRTEVAQLRGELEQSHAGLARSEAENRRMREHLDRILEGLPCGVLALGDGGGISRANPEARRLLALAEGGASLDALSPGMRQLLERARSAAGEVEQHLAGTAEDPRWLAARHAAVGGQPSESSIFILRDVTEDKRQEQQRDRQQRERALAEMAAMLAHEIRNPLASLELFAGLLAGAELPPECHAWVEQVRAGLRTLAATVNNVLQFHSLPSPESAPLDLGDLLDWAKDFLAPITRQARVELLLHNRVHGVLVPADRHCLEQVLLNLLLNAQRALSGGGRVELWGTRIRDAEGDAVTVSVADSGPGIAPEHLSRIFEAGFSTRPGSPGLGLAVCRKIVELHGGRIQVTSPPAGGARFTLRLPLPAKESTHKGRHEGGGDFQLGRRAPGAAE